MTFESDWNKFMTGVGFDLENALAQVAPVDEGTLKNNISHSINGNVITISMPIQGMYTEFGTPPHIIRPVTAKALHWKSGGTDVFATVVHHPGTRPNPWIRPTLKTKFPMIIDKNISRAFT